MLSVIFPAKNRLAVSNRSAPFLRGVLNVAGALLLLRLVLTASIFDIFDPATTPITEIGVVLSPIV
jgi:hypothetical protein